MSQERETPITNTPITNTPITNPRVRTESEESKAIPPENLSEPPATPPGEAPEK